MAIPTNDRYRANLDALQAFQPQVAAEVDSATISDGVKPATGRDGSDTFLIPTTKGHEWFGQSSMPRISATEMFSNVAYHQGNVLLPGIFSGWEARIVADRLAPYAAVFVVESQAQQIKLALHVHDYTDLFRAGRLVLITGEDVCESVLAFFDTHPGYELPTHLFHVPQRTAAQTAELQRLLEQAGEGVLRIQTDVVDASVRAIRKRVDGAHLPDRPRLAVLSAAAGADTVENVSRIRRALDDLGWAYETCVAESPDQCHLAARMQAIARADADFVLYVDDSVGTARTILPDQLPVVSWYVSQRAATGRLGTGCGPFDLFLTSSASLQAELSTAGVDVDAIMRCEVATDPSIFFPTHARPETCGRDSGSVAVVMDLPDDRAEANDVSLPSHIALWNAMREIVEQDVDEFRDESAHAILAEAQRTSGTELCEASSRDHFVNLLGTRIAPAAIGRLAVARMIQAKLDVTVWGVNWSSEDCATQSGSIPRGRRLNEMFNAFEWTVFPFSPAMQMIVDAIAGGAMVAARAGRVPLAQACPALAPILDSVYVYRNTSELIETLRESETARQHRRQNCEVMRERLLAEHTIAHRLTWIADRVRDRQDQPFTEAVRNRDEDARAARPSIG